MVPATDAADALFVEQRPRLIGLAYRLLGSLADAEDAVADTYLRWRELDHRSLERPEAYLTTMVTRRSLDRLRLQARRREVYVGPWLPEPVPIGLLDGGCPTGGDPADVVLLAESLTLGFLTVLDRLDPLERAAFLLHDVFGEPYLSVSSVLDRREDACRQLVHRARRHVAAEHRRSRRPEPARQQRLLAAFATALASGDIEELRRHLADDVVVVSDGGAAVRAARRPVVGAHRVSRFLVGIARRRSARTTVTWAVCNGEPALVVDDPEGRGLRVFVYETDGERIRAIHIVSNPDKLAAVRRSLSGTVGAHDRT
ncbi:MAG: RNA polymerase sigma factor SigJ [Acidimicrobiia bacterium]